MPEVPVQVLFYFVVTLIALSAWTQFSFNNSHLMNISSKIWDWFCIYINKSKPIAWGITVNNPVLITDLKPSCTTNDESLFLILFNMWLVEVRINTTWLLEQLSTRHVCMWILQALEISFTHDVQHSQPFLIFNPALVSFSKCAGICVFFYEKKSLFTACDRHLSSNVLHWSHHRVRGKLLSLIQLHMTN